MSQLKNTFFMECEEKLAVLEADLLRLEETPGDPDLLNNIFRAVHTIKGNSGTFGFTDLMAFAHILEDLLDRLRGEAGWGATVSNIDELISLLLEAKDCLREMVEECREETPVSRERVQEIGRRLKKIMEEDHAAGAEDRGQTAADTGDTADGEGETWGFFEPLQAPPSDPGPCPEGDSLHIPFTLSPELVEGSKGETSSIPTPAETSASPGSLLGDILLKDGVITPTQLTDALSRQKRLGEILVEEKLVTPEQIDQALQKQKEVRKTERSTLRVDAVKVDQLVNLVGEMVIQQSMMAHRTRDLAGGDLPQFLSVVEGMERTVRQLQEGVMAIRMVPMAEVFGKFPRLIRDLSRDLGKRILLKTSGEETELDKTLVERVGDPLIHLIRNAADHGIESPGERQAMGKIPEGTILLQAFQEGGYIGIQVKDDGRGLDVEKIHAKAVARGLVSSGQRPPDAEVFQWIFLPGFSTAESVTGVSGRGVGMDVVRQGVETLGGTIQLDSVRGEGTTVTLRLPLTLAIIDGLSVAVGEDQYIIPLVSIVESIRPGKEMVKILLNRGEVVCLRGECLPLLRLTEVFGGKGVSEPTQGIVTIVEHGGRRAALLADELLDQQQVVIKGLDTHMGKIHGIAGATVLGDGKVALILDVQGLVSRENRG
ncbi:MAG: chemotaxis protein CheA [Nitrospirae bacterium]|nr:chemotaxis protein CheA [Nitrospirota bacterium]